MILMKEEFMTAAKVEEEDAYIDTLLPQAVEICKNIARVDTEEELEALPEARTAVLLASIYLYEHRGDADFHKLMLNLRALMMSRNPAF